MMNKNRRDKASNAYATKQVSFYHNLCRDEFKAGWDAAMTERDAEVKGLVRVLEEHCCVDDCGFHLENETIETLRDCMRAIDEESRAALKAYRAAKGAQP